MTWLRVVVLRALGCFRRRRHDDDLNEEIQTHLCLLVREHVRRGLSTDEARAAARREFGGVERMKEIYRDQRGFRFVDAVKQDLRYGVRQMRRSPTFALVCIGSIALGIAATAAVFAFLDALVLNPLPYKGADRMVTMSLVNKAGQGRGGVALSGPEFIEFQKLDAFDGSIAWGAWDMTMTGGDLPERVLAGQFSGSAFPYFGLAPALGRTLTAADAPLANEPQPVVVLSYRFWQNRYGGDPAALGRTIRLDGQDYTIVGVAASRFHHFNCDLYMPLRRPLDPKNRFAIEARLKPGIAAEAAEATLQPWLSRLAQQTPGRFLPDVHLRLTRLIDTRTTRFGSIFTLLFAAATLLLAVGCANLSILLLARGATRQHEIAVRMAIGASRRRIVGQLVVESLTLALEGAILGVALAWWGVPVIVDWLPRNFLPNDVAIGITAQVLLFSAAAAVLTGVLFGLSPALQLSRPGVSQSMPANVLASSTARRRKRAHQIMMAGQVALTVLLLAGAGTALRAFLSLTRTSLGFNPRHLLVVSIPLAEGRYATWSERTAFFDGLRERIATTPGVEAAAMSFYCCSPGTPGLMPMELTGRPDGKYQPASVQQVTPDFFSTLQIPLLRGRLWSDAEHSRAAQVAVVNQRTAKQLWPQGDPIGQRIRLPFMTARESWQVAAPGSDEPLEIVGVVGDTPNRGLRGPDWPAVYVPITLVMGDIPNLIVRTRAEPLAIVRTLREQVHALDPNQVVSTTTTAEEILRAAGWGREEVVASLFLVFAILGVTLAGIGLHSVVSYVVSQRAREFGIRSALGAQAGDLVWRALRSTVTTVAVGAGIGITLSVTLDRAVLRLTQVNTRDPLVLAGVVGALFSVALGATLIPARRAARVDPMVALRCE